MAGNWDTPHTVTVDKSGNINVESVSVVTGSGVIVDDNTVVLTRAGDDDVTTPTSVAS